MREDIKEKWVAALRSGEYMQGTGVLVQTDKDGVSRYCCLGVLCCLAGKSGEVDIGINEDGCAFEYVTEFGYDAEEEACLPAIVARWAGLPDDGDPEVPYGEGEEYLARLNDGGMNSRTGEQCEQHSFERIADLIEKGL